MNLGASCGLQSNRCLVPRPSGEPDYSERAVDERQQTDRDPRGDRRRPEPSEIRSHQQRHIKVKIQSSSVLSI